MVKIKHICAREILASGGSPSLEVDVMLDNGSKGEASVSYGASAGSLEAFVLLDDDARRYNGKGMLKAVAKVNEKITPLLLGKDPTDQRGIDKLMIDADGTENKQNLGANAILGVSMAVARAAANDAKLELYEYLSQAFKLKTTSYKLPKPMVVMIEGGVHADNSTDLQEYLVSALRNDWPAKENVRMEMEIYGTLKKLLKSIGLSTNVGNEGAFAPFGLTANEKPLEYLMEATKEAGYKAGVDFGLSIDAAASEFFHDGLYQLKTEKRSLDSENLTKMYLEWFKKYPIITAEDCLSESDWDNWPKLLAQAGDVKIIADDLTVTNTKLWQKAIDMKAANAILIKLNQAGTVTETIGTCLLANSYKLTTIPSHRGGGETNDTFLVDLAVAVGSEWIKVGPTRGERVCKYNRLMRVEELLT
ncbi:MAG: phosphopyruvate hydratase [Candidatus Doudnabacteria bacterium]|nr:phosphopyruvate hydratase [Candidatus Doudnabacteria bacterium]